MCTCKCGTLWLTRLLMATKEPSACMPRLDRARQQLHINEKRSGESRRKIPERFIVMFRNEQRVAREQRPIVQKREREGIFEDDAAASGARDDLAEFAVRFRIHRLSSE